MGMSVPVDMVYGKGRGRKVGIPHGYILSLYTTLVLTRKIFKFCFIRELLLYPGG